MNDTDLAIEKLLNDIALQRLGYHIDGTALYDKGEEEDFECTGDCENCFHDCDPLDNIND